MRAVEELSLEEAAEELDLIEAALAKQRYPADPVFWASHRLGDTLWSKQREIMESVLKHRRTAVQSCHEIGKSYIAAVTVGWWLDIWPAGDAFVVTSAPSAPQVKAILWREIGRVHARGNLGGRVNQTEWYMRGLGGEGKEELVAFGRKPDEYDPTSFQGIHAPRVLIVFDEACGIPLSLWEAGDSLIANDTSKALAIGNPDDPLTEFAAICAPGSGWNTIAVGAFDSPNFTGEDLPRRIREQLIGHTYVEEKRRRWAPHWYWVDKHGNPVDDYRQGARVVCPAGADEFATTPFWQSKVLGRFPTVAEADALIPLHWIRAAQQRSLPPIGDEVLTLDVGGGGDASTCGHRRGPVFRVKWEDHEPDTMRTCGKLLGTLNEVNARARFEGQGEVRARVDRIGIGKGIADRCRELRKPVDGIAVSETANEEDDYYNLRSEAYWAVRTAFERGEIDIDPLDEDLAAELSNIKYKRTSSGQVQVESKIEMKKRKLPSPNRADSLMLSYVKKIKKKTKATFGRRH